MNKIFKVIWNKTTQRLEVVSELAKGAVKSSSNNVGNLAKDLSKPVLKLSLLSICLGYPTWAMAATGVDKVDIMGYSHVNETDADKVTENRIITTKDWENQFNNNNGTYHESAGAQGNRAITSGVKANALAKDSIAIGSLANVNNNWGKQSVEAERSIAIGREATVNAGKDSIAMGSGAQILHNDATTLNANNAIAIGKLAKVDEASNAIALGHNARVEGHLLLQQQIAQQLKQVNQRLPQAPQQW